MKYCKPQQVLNLTLTAVPFDLMQRGVKPVEYRKASPWIAARLQGKRYTHVKFTNGYGAQFPFFVAEYHGFVMARRAFRKVYDCGLVVDVEPGDYIIILGKVAERGTLQNRNIKKAKNAPKSFTRVFRHKVW